MECLAQSGVCPKPEGVILSISTSAHSFGNSYRAYHDTNSLMHDPLAFLEHT